MKKNQRFKIFIQVGVFLFTAPLFADLAPTLKSPANFSVKVLGGCEIDLTWDISNSLKTIGYNLYWRKSPNGKWVKVNVKPIKSKHYDIRGVQKKTTYSFFVRTVASVDPLIESPNSIEQNAEVLFDLPTLFTPSKDAKRDGIIDVYKLAGMGKWPKPSQSDIKWYGIFIGEVPGGPYGPFGSIREEAGYIIGNLEAGKRYYLVFTSFRKDERESQFSREISTVAEKDPGISGYNPNFRHNP